MGKTDKVRQQEYRQRMLDQGYRQFAFWLDKDTQAALKLLKSVGTDDLSTLVNQSIKHYHSYMLSKTVSSNVTSNTKPVSSNVTSKTKLVSSNVTRNVTSNRHMSQDLEDHILELRQAGMALREISNKLASEGYRNAKGDLYNTSTISKAEARAKRRRGN